MSRPTITRVTFDLPECKESSKLKRNAIKKNKRKKGKIQTKNGKKKKNSKKQKRKKKKLNPGPQRSHSALPASYLLNVSNVAGISNLKASAATVKSSASAQSLVPEETCDVVAVGLSISRWDRGRW